MKSDQFRVMNNGVEVARRPHPIHAVNIAQGLCCNAYKTPVTLQIVRKPVLGPESILYRVDRTEDGIVYTTILSQED